MEPRKAQETSFGISESKRNSRAGNKILHFFWIFDVDLDTSQDELFQI
jgi:hypothetical protein